MGRPVVPKEVAERGRDKRRSRFQRKIAAQQEAKWQIKAARPRAQACRACGSKTRGASRLKQTAQKETVKSAMLLSLREANRQRAHGPVSARTRRQARRARGQSAGPAGQPNRGETTVGHVSRQTGRRKRRQQR